MPLHEADGATRLGRLVVLDGLSEAEVLFEEEDLLYLTDAPAVLTTHLSNHRRQLLSLVLSEALVFLDASRGEFDVV